MIEKNLFSEIFKYTQSEKKAPLENYCTEIFVYILRQLLKQKKENEIAYRIFELFGFNKITEKDFEHIEIITQESHFSNDKTVIPDIIIKNKNKNVIIEVKINSGLNYYNKTEKEVIDQIELYKKITDIKVSDVFLLSKHILFSDSLDNSKKNILWSQIHSILADSKNEIVKNFVLFLEENGMESSIIKNGAENGMDSICAILSLIKNSWTNEKYQLELNNGCDFFGFKLKKTDGWIGQLKEKKEYIVFEPPERLNEKAEKMYKEENTMETAKDGHYIFAKIKIKDISCFKTDKEQKLVFQKWLNDKVNILLT